MEYFELLERRFSVRGYLDKEVKQSDLEKVCEAVRLAPTAKNAQPFHLWIVQGEKRSALNRAYGASWFAEAPVVLVFTGLKREGWLRCDGTSYLMCDVAIVADHAVLAATALGLGTCWVAAFDAGAVVEALNLPDGEEPLLLIPLGYPKPGSTRPRVRKGMEQLIRRA